MARAYSPGWLAAAVATSLTVVTAAPLVGQISAMLRDVAKGHYTTVLGAIVSVSALAAIAVAIVAIRDRRRQRYAWLASAILLAVSYGFVSRTGVADADAA